MVRSCKSQLPPFKSNCSEIEQARCTTVAWLGYPLVSNGDKARDAMRALARARLDMAGLRGFWRDLVDDLRLSSARAIVLGRALVCH